MPICDSLLRDPRRARARAGRDGRLELLRRDRVHSVTASPRYALVARNLALASRQAEGTDTARGPLQRLLPQPGEDRPADARGPAPAAPGQRGAGGGRPALRRRAAQGPAPARRHRATMSASRRSRRKVYARCAASSSRPTTAAWCCARISTAAGTTTSTRRIDRLLGARRGGRRLPAQDRTAAAAT